LFLDIKPMAELHTTCLCARILELCNEYANLQFFARIEIVDNVPVSKFWNPIKIIVHFIW